MVAILSIFSLLCTFLFLIDLAEVGVDQRLLNPGLSALFAGLTSWRLRRQYNSLSENFASIADENCDSTAGPSNQVDFPNEQQTSNVPWMLVTIAMSALVIWAYIPERHMFVGNAALQKRDLQKAEGSYLTAIKSEWLPKRRIINANIRLGDTYFAFATENNGGDQAYLDAHSAYRTAEEMDKNTLDVFFGLGNVYRRLGAYQESISLYLRARELEGAHPHWSYIGIAVTHRVLGDFEKALAELDTLKTLDLNNIGMAFFYHKGLTLFHKGDYESAIEAFSNGIPHQEDYPWAHIFLACSHAALGNLHEAQKSYEEGYQIYWRQMPDFVVTQAVVWEVDSMDTERALISANAANPETKSKSLKLCRDFNVDDSPKGKRKRHPQLPPL